MEKAALVTGGSSGIGLAIAHMLREEGFALTLAARTREKVESAAREVGALAVAANVAHEEDCQRIVDEHREQHGRLDVLVNSAGTGIGGALDQLPVKHVDLQLTHTLNRAEEEHGIRATAISPGFVDTPMTGWAPVPREQMIRPQDCAEIVRALLHLGPHARVPHVVIERVAAEGF